MTTIDQLIEKVNLAEDDMLYLSDKYYDALENSTAEKSYYISERMDRIHEELTSATTEIQSELDKQLVDYFNSSDDTYPWTLSNKSIASAILKNKLDIASLTLDQALVALKSVDKQLESYFDFGNRPGPLILEMYSNHLNERITDLLDKKIEGEINALLDSDTELPKVILDSLDQKFKELSSLNTQALFIGDPIYLTQKVHLEYVNTRTTQLKVEIESILDKQLDNYMDNKKSWNKRAACNLLHMSVSCPPLPASDDDTPKPFPILPFIFAIATTIPFLLVLNS